MMLFEHRIPSHLMVEVYFPFIDKSTLGLLLLGRILMYFADSVLDFLLFH